MASQRVVKTFDEINITPLTDIFLVLLIIMMVMAPMMNQPLAAELDIPDIASGSAVEPGNTVEITKDGQFFVNGQPATAAGLATSLKAVANKAPGSSASGGDATTGTSPSLSASTGDDDALQAVGNGVEATATPPEEGQTLVVRADKQTPSKAVLQVMEAAREAGFERMTVAGEPLDAARAKTLEQQEPALPTTQPTVPPEGNAF